MADNYFFKVVWNSVHDTYLDTVDVRLDVASLVQIQNVYRPKDLTTLRKRYRSNTIQDRLARCPPAHTLGLPVPMNSLNIEHSTDTIIANCQELHNSGNIL